MTLAACAAHDTALFFPNPQDTIVAQAATEIAAKAVCDTCPVLMDCLDFALAVGDDHAIMGRTTPKERQRLHGFLPNQGTVEPG